MLINEEKEEALKEVQSFLAVALSNATYSTLKLSLCAEYEKASILADICHSLQSISKNVENLLARKNRGTPNA